MTQTRFRRFRHLAAFAAVPTLVLWAFIAKAQEPDDATSDAEAEALSPKKAEPRPAAPAAAHAPNAPPAPEAFIEHMGPETFPGRLRGLYGGSLWLEPDFQGLQWPQNTRTGLGISALFWVDSGNERITRSTQQLPNTTLWFQQGRGLLRLTPAYVRDSFFAQAQVELVGNMCQAANPVCVNTGTFDTDDLFVRLGEWNRWDLKVGRFEGWEVYHLGMGMDQYTLERIGAGMTGVDAMITPALDAPQFYGVTYLHDRPREGLAVGHVALHVYATDSLRFELLGKLGTDNYRSDNGTGDTASNYLGARPVAIFDVGWFKVRIGAEYQRRMPTTQTITPGTPAQKVDAPAQRNQKGVGGSFQVVIDPVLEFGVNAAIGQQHDKNGLGMEVPENTYVTKSLGGFANLRVAGRWLTGVGINWTSQTDDYLASGSTDHDFTSHLQGFAALQYLVVGQLYVKAVAGVARADFLPSDQTLPQWHNYMYSGRIRFLYIY